ncbi:hypothetical protein [Parendozoicomonas haliclonae]|uniref:Uncharacterized protein n=1 Tax=Parendozoicomonas haliclonae TaxID=1960125 RepID=A0A1X7AL96_9GAMM|nr:hypothetical protein [Parendozoicomonas haliclonae]SMA47975.1 hypothetical protein EHSB41UT_02621 [Parendozoicomonas haliclonae]
MGVGRIDGSDRTASNDILDNSIQPPEPSVGHHGTRMVYQVIPQQLFKKLTKAEKDIIRQAERIARREERRAMREAKKSALENETVTAVESGQDRGTVDFSDPYAVVLELAKMADGMENSQNPKVVLMLTETINQMLKQIHEQEERRAENRREEQEQEEQDRKTYEQRRQQDDHIRQQQLQRIEQENSQRQNRLNNT